MKKVILALTAAGTVLAVGTLAVNNVFAEDTNTARDSVISKVAEKLGLSTTEVETAFDEARTEVHEQVSAERDAAIKEAYENGDLTQRQYVIITTMDEIRDETFDSSTPRRGGFNGEMLALLNDKGLDVTQDELDELRSIMQDLDLVGGFGQGGRGMGMHRDM